MPVADVVTKRDGYVRPALQKPLAQILLSFQRRSAHFKPWGPVSWLEPVYYPVQLSPKSAKEFASFIRFARTSTFARVIKSLTCKKVAQPIKIQLHSDGQDPPDISLPEYGLGVEITDFPPDAAVLNRILAATPGSCSIPTFAETGCDPAAIKRHIDAPVSQVAPKFASALDEFHALALYLSDLIRKKDVPGNHILLLDGARFSWPEAEAVKAALKVTKPKHVSCVVLALPNKAISLFASRRRKLSRSNRPESL